MTSDITASGWLDKLEQLRGEASALMTLGYKLRGEIAEALNRIEPDSPVARRRAGRRYLAEASSAQLRRDLLEMRGAKSTAVLRTKLNSDLEVRRGRRHACNGAAHVSNGHTAIS